MYGKNVNLHWKSSKFSLALQPEALVNTSGRVDFSSPGIGHIMLKVLSNILCDLDPTVKVICQKAGICDGVPSTFALVTNCDGSEGLLSLLFESLSIHIYFYKL